MKSFNRSVIISGALILSVLTALVGFLIAAWSPEPGGGDSKESPTPAGESAFVQPPAHRRMVALLRGVAARTDDENRYLGSKLARDLERQLAGLGASGSEATRWRLHRLAGVARLKLGDEREGIEHLLRAYELLPRVKSEITPYRVVDTVFQLGVAYMRFGETRNCCARRTAESCIVPIRGQGVHSDEEGSRKAIACFLEVLRNPERNPAQHYQSLWLLNIAYMTLGRYPEDVPEPYLVPPDAFRSEIDFPRFRNIASEAGVDTFNLSGGVIVEDFNNDDLLDILTSTWDTSGEMRFFVNKGDGTFSDRAREAGLGGLCGGLNLLQADYDNDGHMDFLVLRGAWLGAQGRHPNSLVRNNGDGTFSDVTLAAGLGGVHYPTQTAAWADYDNDGDVDLYIGNETTSKLRAPCQLFRNKGDGTFEDVARKAGVENLSFTKGVAWGDYDGDRYPDLYVSNLVAANRLYRNNGDGTFTDVAPSLGVTRPRESFPVWFWDFDNDGALDIFASSYTGRIEHLAAYHVGVETRYERPGLYRGDGRGGFRDVAAEKGLDYPMLPMGANFGDVDGDGFLDFYLGTGDPNFRSLTPNLMFLNLRGERFVNVTMAGGFGHLQKGHAVAFADLDNDGDCDVFEQMGGAYPGDRFSDALYENPGFERSWITVKLVGRESNRAAIGARIRLEVTEEGATRSVYRHVSSGGSFGASPLRQTIGLGNAGGIRLLEVFWPTTGRTQRFEDVERDQAIEIREGETGFRRLPLERFRLSEQQLPDPAQRRG